MNIFESLFGSEKYKSPGYQPCKIDLRLFTFDNIKLSNVIPDNHYLYDYLKQNEVYESIENGIEIGTNNNSLDYIFVTLDSFNGSFLLNKKPLKLSFDFNPDDILEKFGDPYWVDDSDNEIIQFYEYENGEIELQFEYSNRTNLSHITMLSEGVLSSQEQRDHYHVTNRWPPSN